MNQELVFTSAPRGLHMNKSGFCTVAQTPSMSPNLQRLLESMSAYRHLYAPGSADAVRNPVVYSHLIPKVGGRSIHVLSRISDAGLDYSNRSNKLAHHIAFERIDSVVGGPTQVLASQNFLKQWEGDPRQLPNREIRSHLGKTQPCRTWKKVCGDSGWAGALVEAFLKSKTAYLVVQPTAPVIELLEEAICLLPEDRRWQVTFTSFFTRLPPNVTCAWRCVIAGSPEAQAAARHPQNVIIDLTSKLPEATNRYADHARHGKSIGRTGHTKASTKSATKSRMTDAADMPLVPSNDWGDGELELEALPSSQEAQPRRSRKKSVDGLAPLTTPAEQPGFNPTLMIVVIAGLLLLGVITTVVAMTVLENDDVPEVVERLDNDPEAVAKDPEKEDLSPVNNPAEPAKKIDKEATQPKEDNESTPNQGSADIEEVPKVVEPAKPTGPPLDSGQVSVPQFFQDLKSTRNATTGLVSLKRSLADSAGLQLQLIGPRFVSMELNTPGIWEVRAGKKIIGEFRVEGDESGSELVFQNLGVDKRTLQQFGNSLLELTNRDGKHLTTIRLRETRFQMMPLSFSMQADKKISVREFGAAQSLQLHIDDQFILRQMEDRVPKLQTMDFELEVQEGLAKFDLRWVLDQLNDDHPFHRALDELYFWLEARENQLWLNVGLNHYLDRSIEYEKDIKKITAGEFKSRIQKQFQKAKREAGGIAPDRLAVVERVIDKINEEFRGLQKTHSLLYVPQINSEGAFVGRPRVNDFSNLMNDLRNQMAWEKLEISRIKGMEGSQKAEWKRSRGQIENLLKDSPGGSEGTPEIPYQSIFQQDFDNAFFNLIIPVRVSKFPKNPELDDFLLISLGEFPLDDDQQIQDFRNYIQTEQKSSGKR